MSSTLARRFRNRVAAILIASLPGLALQSFPALASGLGGYAVIHPDGHVCGVVVATSADPFGNGGVTASEYMGCPAGSPFVFQTKPSPTGNVAGWHGTDVIYSNGTFRLSSGTTITNGIATDPNGRVWDTGSGETITPAPSTGSGSSSGGSSETGSATTPTDSANSTAPAPSPTAPSETSSGTSSAIAPSTSSGPWSPPADSDRPIYDDTYTRICLELGWINCGEWTIYDAEGNQKNRLVGPIPFTFCETSGVNVCGGTPKGFAVKTGRYFPPSANPETAATGSRSPGVTDSASTVIRPESSTASTSPATTLLPGSNTSAGGVDSASGQVSPGSSSTGNSESAATTSPTSPASSQNGQSPSGASVPEINDDGVEEDPSGELNSRRLDDGRYRLAVRTNLDSEQVVLRATKRGSKTIRFQVTLNENGRAVVLTNRDLSGYRVSIVFGDQVLDAKRLS